MTEINRVMNEIGGIGPGGPGLERGSDVKAPEGGTPFKKMLTDAIDNVSKLQQDADLSLEKLKDGETGVAEVMIAYRKAQIAFEALMQIRNKVVDAFEEFQRMRI